MSNKMQCYTVYFIWKLLDMFRVVPPPIIRSAYNCIYSIWYLSHRYCYLPLYPSSGAHTTLSTASGIYHTVTATCRYTHHQERIQEYLQHLVFFIPSLIVWQIPDAVNTVVFAPDDVWWYHPKYVEQFPDKINCVTLHLVGHILEYSYDVRTHER